MSRRRAVKGPLGAVPRLPRSPTTAWKLRVVPQATWGTSGVRPRHRGFGNDGSGCVVGDYWSVCEARYLKSHEVVSLVACRIYAKGPWGTGASSTGTCTLALSSWAMRGPWALCTGATAHCLSTAAAWQHNPLVGLGAGRLGLCLFGRC